VSSIKVAKTYQANRADQIDLYTLFIQKRKILEKAAMSQENKGTFDQI
jgi:hypothetical protein